MPQPISSGIHKLPDVPTLVAERAKALEILVVAVNLVAREHRDTRKPICAVVNVRIHHEFLRLRVVKHFGSFQDPIASKPFRVGQLDDLAAKFPMRQIRRGITRHIAIIRVVVPRPVFAKPIGGLPQLGDAAAVRLNGFATVVQPDRAGTDGLSSFTTAGCDDYKEADGWLKNGADFQFQELLEWCPGKDSNLGPID